MSHAPESWLLTDFMKRPLKPTEVWRPNVRAPKRLLMSISLVFTVLGLILWNKMVVMKKLSLWLKIGRPVWLMIRKFAIRFRVCTNHGPKVTRTTEAIQRLFPAFPNCPNYSLKSRPLRLKLNVFTAIGSMLKKMLTILPEQL